MFIYDGIKKASPDDVTPPGKQINLQVDCRFFPDARPPVPRTIWMEDGRGYPVLEIVERRALDKFAHGYTGMLYTCRLRTGIVKIWFSENSTRWYM